MSAEYPIYYFGAWGQAGHYLWNPDKQHVRDLDIRRLRLPTPGQLDGGHLFLPREVVGMGELTYLPAPNLTILAWWGNNPWDGRPNVNQALIITSHSGNAGQSVSWNMFQRHFPDLEKLLKRPVMY